MVPVTEFSLSFKVDSYDLKEGSLVTECCRQFQAFTLSLYPISPRSKWLKPASSRFVSWLPALNKNPAIGIVFNTSFQYTYTSSWYTLWLVSCDSLLQHFCQSFGFRHPESNIHVKLRNPPTPHFWWTTFDILTWEMVFWEVCGVVGGLRLRFLSSLSAIIHSFAIITARLLFSLIHTDRRAWYRLH